MNLKINRAPTPADIKNGLVAVDLETTAKEPFDGRIFSITLCSGDDVWVLTHNYKSLIPVLTDPGITKIFHNALFDMSWLKWFLRVDVWPVYDTLLAERVLNTGYRPGEKPNDLESVLARTFGVMLNKEVRERFFGYTGPLDNELLSYMIEDVTYLERLREKQLEQISKYALGKVVRIEFDVIPVVVDMYLGGVKFDESLWEQYLVQIDERIQQYEDALRGVLGPEFVCPIERKVKKQPVTVELLVGDINFNSSAQIVAVFNAIGINLTTTDQKVLSEKIAGGKYKGRSLEFLTTLLQYKHWKTMQRWKYTKHINSHTGKIHPSWNQIEADTGRFSCSEPNMQNVPRPTEDEPNFRRLWLPDSSDYVIIAADYSQQEPRILAQLCQDSAMLKAASEDDIYLEFARLMYGREIFKKDPERQVAKTFVLAVGYGGGPKTLALSSGLSLDHCAEIRTKILNAFPGMDSWGKQQLSNLITYGYVSTISGRKRWYPELLNPKRHLTEKEIFSKYANQARNTPVQGSAADMMKMALVRVNTMLRKEGVFVTGKLNNRMWITVHDELEVHIHKDLAEVYYPKILRTMEEAGSVLCPDVKWLAEGKILEKWDK